MKGINLTEHINRHRILQGACLTAVQHSGHGEYTCLACSCMALLHCSQVAAALKSRQVPENFVFESMLHLS